MRKLQCERAFKALEPAEIAFLTGDRVDAYHPASMADKLLAA
jgi:hypothetical protein